MTILEIMALLLIGYIVGVATVVLTRPADIILIWTQVDEEEEE